MPRLANAKQTPTLHRDYRYAPNAHMMSPVARCDRCCCTATPREAVPTMRNYLAKRCRCIRQQLVVTVVFKEPRDRRHGRTPFSGVRDHIGDPKDPVQ